MITHKKHDINNSKKNIVIFPQFGPRNFDGQKYPRKKVNFMINQDLIKAIHFFIPQGERSDFVNKSLEECLRDIARRKAFHAMDEFRKTHKWHMTDAQIRKARDYGRE